MPTNMPSIGQRHCCYESSEYLSISFDKDVYAFIFSHFIMDVLKIPCFISTERCRGKGERKDFAADNGTFQRCKKNAGFVFFLFFCFFIYLFIPASSVDRKER